MSITLYSSIRCPWAARAWLALIEAKIPFDLVEIDLSVPRPDWYLKEVNPIGKVPALKLSNGQVICESSVCAEYVADVSGTLLPRDPLQRSAIRFFTETFISKFPAGVYSIYNSDSAKQTELLLAAVSTVNDLLHTYLRDGPFLLGSQDYTLAEVDCVPFLARFRMAGMNKLYPAGLYEHFRDDPKYSLFNRYMDACLSRASHKAIWKEEENLEGTRKRLSSTKKAKKQDYIFLDNLRLSGKVGLSAFSFPDTSFPLSISVKIKTEPVEENSDIYSVSYGDVCREITSLVDKGVFPRLEDLSAAIIRGRVVGNDWQSLVVSKEGGMLRADKETLEIFPDGRARSSITGIRIGCIIGVYEHEREKKQDVIIHLTMLRNGWDPVANGAGQAFDMEEYKRTMLDALATFVEGSSFKTVEALALATCDLTLGVLPTTVEAIEVWISKPSALVFVQSSGVCITRSRT